MAHADGPHQDLRSRCPGLTARGAPEFVGSVHALSWALLHSWEPFRSFCAAPFEGDPLNFLQAPSSTHRSAAATAVVVMAALCPLLLLRPSGDGRPVAS